MSRDSDNSISFGMGLLGGILAGIAVGILYAPQTGEKTREELKETIDTIKTNIKNKDDIFDKKNIDMIDKIKYTFETQLSRLNDAIKAGKMASAKRKEENESDITY
ncbi:MAG: YtxH domain-containing protein [Candidatus Gastranaerophilales bacterium]|nr:YtxH domain-containing protein [Candidatus Gastranaerophilales bacterium]